MGTIKGNELPASLNFALCDELPVSLNFDLSGEQQGELPGNELPASLDLKLCKELPASLDFDLAINPCGEVPVDTIEGNFFASYKVALDSSGAPGSIGTFYAKVIPELDSSGIIGVTGNFYGKAPIDLDSTGVIGVTGNFYGKAPIDLDSTGIIGITGDYASDTKLPYFDADGEWDANVFRGIINYSNVLQEECARRESKKCMLWENSDRLKVIKREVFRDGTTVEAPKCSSFKQLGKIYRPIEFEHSEGKNTYGNICEHYVLAYPKHVLSTYLFDTATPIQKSSCGSFVYATPMHGILCGTFEQAKPSVSRFRSNFQWATKTSKQTCGLFEDAKLPEWVWPPPEGPITPPEPPEEFEGTTDLDLRCLLPDPIWGPVWFYLDEENECARVRPPWWVPPGAIPIREVYIVVNNVHIFRLSDGAEINATNVSVSIDYQSWCWSFSANIDKLHLPLVEPTSNGPVEIEININDFKWYMVVENWSETRSFGRDSVSITGRSLSAQLASPYAISRDFVNDNDRTILQLLDDELDRAATDPIWTINWQPESWLVPAGAFTYQRFTPMKAITQIASSINGVLQTHPYNRELYVLPEYKFMPWAWSGLSTDDIDLTLPDSLILDFSGKYEERPLYNGIYVMGTKYGVTGKATVDGTDGQFLHPTVTDPLITASEAVRERARSELGRGGKKSTVSLSLPVMSEIGVLTPGKYISVYRAADSNDSWNGVIRDTSISASRSGGRGNSPITTNQTVSVERYYG